MDLKVDADELEALRTELAGYKEQNQWLQERNTELVDLVRWRNIQTHVAQFHRAMGIPVLDRPQVPPDDRVRLRLRLIAEEFFEVLEACGIGSLMPSTFITNAINERYLKIDLPALADALCDLDYVVEGARLEFGIDGGPVLAEVHRANMDKLGGPKREDGKQMRPEGWQPPDVARVLREQGW